jgi:predicted RNA-binding protein
VDRTIETERNHDNQDPDDVLRQVLPRLRERDAIESLRYYEEESAGIQAATVAVQRISTGTLTFGDLGWRLARRCRRRSRTALLPRRC